MHNSKIKPRSDGAGFCACFAMCLCEGWVFTLYVYSKSGRFLCFMYLSVSERLLRFSLIACLLVCVFYLCLRYSFLCFLFMSVSVRERVFCVYMFFWEICIWRVFHECLIDLCFCSQCVSARLVCIVCWCVSDRFLCVVYLYHSELFLWNVLLCVSTSAMCVLCLPVCISEIFWYVVCSACILKNNKTFYNKPFYNKP